MYTFKRGDGGVGLAYMEWCECSAVLEDVFSTMRGQSKLRKQFSQMMHLMATLVKVRAINLSCEGGGGGINSANEYKVCSGSGHHKRFMVCVMETVKWQMTL